ncbi:unnamed protein product, partial [Prorocentrum cordatum]
AATKMRIHGGDHRAEDPDGRPSDDPLALAEDKEHVSRLDRCCLSMGRRKKICGEMAKVASLKYKLEEARQLFRTVKPVQLDLLGVSGAARMIDPERQKEAIHMLTQEGDTAKPMQMQPINDVFLSLVEAKLWARIQGGEFIGGEGEELLTCVAAARPLSPYYLTDLDHLRRGGQAVTCHTCGGDQHPAAQGRCDPCGRAAPWGAQSERALEAELGASTEPGHMRVDDEHGRVPDGASTPDAMPLRRKS